MNKMKWYQKPLSWFVLVLLLLPFLYVGGMVLLFALNWAWRDIPRHGEHLATAVEFSPHATNYSFYNRLLHCVCEFDILEDAFLEMCKDKKWNPIAIESLPDLLPFQESEMEPNTNYEREIPLKITRYVYTKPGHENCGLWWNCSCQVDTTGKTDDSCFRAVSRGYYFEVRGSDAGGIRVLYDSENERCYIHSNPH